MPLTVQALSEEDAMLNIIEADNMDKAEKLLREGEIKGIFVVDKNINLTVNENGMDETILDMILTSYEQYSTVIQSTMKNNPQNIENVIKSLMTDKSYLTKEKTSDGSFDNLVTYFYAIFAMSCLFAGFSGVDRASKMQADTTSLGIRRNMAPNSKIYLIISDFFTSLIVQFVFEVIAFLYMKFVLGVDFGTKYAAMMLVLLMGSGIGISMGMIVGCVKNKTTDTKIGITCAISMCLSIMADLVANGVRNAIEHYIPIINRINPAALIVDSFYALNVYDNYDRFFRNMTLLGIIIFLLLFCSFLLVRRTRYASV